MASRTEARSSLTVVRRQTVASRGDTVYAIGWGPEEKEEGLIWVEGGSMEVIFRREGSVRTRAFSSGLGGIKDDERGVLEDAVLDRGSARGVLVEFGKRDCVMNVRLVSTWDSLRRMVEHISSMISSSLRKLTSRLVGCTLTSTR